MSNLPPNPFAQGQQMNNHDEHYNQVPLSQPNYVGMKQNTTSNSPLPMAPQITQNSMTPGHQNNFEPRTNSSPAFNVQRMMPPPSAGMLPPNMSPAKLPTSVPSSSPHPYSEQPVMDTSRMNPTSSPQNFPPQPKQINVNTPPLIPSSQSFSQSILNGPSVSGSAMMPPTSKPLNPSTEFGQVPSSFPSNQVQPGPPKPTSVPSSQHNVPYSSPMSGQSRNSPMGPGLVSGPPKPNGFNGQPMPQPHPYMNTGISNGPVPHSSQSLTGPTQVSSPYSSPMSLPFTSMPSPYTQVSRSGPPQAGIPPPTMSPVGSNMQQPGPPNSQSGAAIMPTNMQSTRPMNMQQGASMMPPSRPLNMPPVGPNMPPTGPPNMPPAGPNMPPSGPLNMPPARPNMPPPGTQSMPPGPPTGLNMPPNSAGMSMPPVGPNMPPRGPNMPPLGPPNSAGPGMPPLVPPSSIGSNIPQVGANMPPRGPNMPPPGPNMSPLGPQNMQPHGLQGMPSSISNMPPSGPNMPPGPKMPPMGPPQGLQSGPMGPPQGLQSGPMGPPQGLQSGPTSPQGMPQNQAPGMSNMQNRYPQMPQNTMQQNYNQQYTTQNLIQQTGQLSVTKQGFDQLWGHQIIDLLQVRRILPEYPDEPPEIRLPQQFADSSNCSPEVFRCTMTRIPETNSLLQKSRLPLGILIHPFKDLNQLPVIHCSTIVRCRACRTYINPFVYFVDSERWKCNLCFGVNDLPEDFQYDPVSKSYGDPSRRPEIRSATIEYIAPAEYMLRPPQPAVYLFLLDVSQLARESGYIEVFCKTLRACLDQLPGDARTQVGFICFDSQIHYYLMSDGLTRPKEMTVLDIDEVFLPSPESLLVNLGERRELINELLAVLPQRYSTPGVPVSALGAALEAAYKLMAPTGGRITVLQTCLPNAGPGALQPREDPNARSSKDVCHLNPATDFYKRLALDCSGAQIAVDLFLLNSQYSDLATLSGMSKFSAGSVYHIPLFKASRTWQADQFRRMLDRYLTRKIGFEAVMRVRCTRGITIHTFHGNFFVRSTDLLSLPNVSPDAGFGMQLTIEESLTELQQVCFQAALLYTSSKGERRIRVHTLALPVASNLSDILNSADQECILGLLTKMAVDRCISASMSEAKEALINVAVDILSAYKLSQGSPQTPGLIAPASLRLLPLYLLAALKRKAFRTGTSTRLDDRVADMCDMKTMPLLQILRAIYPDLYPIHELGAHVASNEKPPVPDPPRLSLSAERVNSTGAYLLDDGETMIIYVGHSVSPAFLSDTFGVTSYSQLPDEARSLPRVQQEGNALLHAFIERLNDERPYESNLLLLRDTSPSRSLFTERLIEDRVESAFSYYEFLQHVKTQVK